MAQVALAVNPLVAKPDVLRADPTGPLDLGAVLTAHVAGLPACGDGSCVKVSLAYFNDAMKGIGVRTTSVALTDGGSLELPVIGSAGGQELDAKTLLALWYSNSKASRWDKLPKSCRGAGPPGALLFADLALDRTIVKSPAGWPAGLNPGALLQLWRNEAEYQDLRDNGTDVGLGHSCVFRSYVEGDATRITVADNMNILHEIPYGYLGLRFVMAANLAKGRLVTLG